MGEKGPKRPKNRVFGLLRKIESLHFARNDLKWSVLWLANFQQKSHIWENSCSRDLGQKGPKKDKNVSSVRQWCKVISIGSLFFLFFCMKLKNHKRRKVTEPDLSGKFSFSKKWAKGAQKGPKWSKNRFFGLLRKIESLVFARNYLKWSVLWLANFLRKSHIWENSRSRDLGQKGPKVVKINFFVYCSKLAH